MRLNRLKSALVGLMATCAVPFAATASEIVVVQGSDVLTLDPSANSASVSINVYLNIFDQLTEINDDGSLGARLAKSWETNEDTTEWTFKLVDGAKFHNGAPVTSADVAWTFQKIMDDEKSPLRSYLSQVESFEATDPLTVKVKLKKPFVTFGRQVSLVSILPKDYYAEVGAEKFSSAPVGSGPFTVAEWMKDSHVTLAANPDYWGGAPSIEKVTFRAMPNEASRVAGLIAGEIDIVPSLTPPMVPTIEGEPGVQVAKVTSNRTVYLGFNGERQGPLADVRLRQAIDHAIDRKTITDLMLKGLGVPTSQIPAPVTFGYDPTLELTTYDPEKAKALLAEAGYDGTPIPFEYPTNRFANAQQTAQAIEGYLSEVGLKVDMRPMEFAAFFPLWLGNKLEHMYMFSLGITIMDADLILNLEYETGVSHGYWRNAEVDELSLKQRASNDPEERKAIMAKIWRMSQEAAAFAPVYSEVQAYAIRDCAGWTPRADERLNFHKATSTCTR